MGKHPVSRWVAGYDLHYPQYDPATFNCMLEVIHDIRPDGFIFGGDQLDNAEISHHNKGLGLYKPRRAYLANTEGFVKDILAPLESVLGKAHRTWIIGNHDDWERQYIESHPEFEGVIERPKLLNLEAGGWQIIPLGHAKRLGHLNVIHGEVLTGYGNQAGLYPARKAVMLYGDNVLAGHTHAPQSFANISPVERKKKHMGYIAPILGSTNPDYLRNRPTAWMQGFVVIEFYANGFFNLYPIITFDGRCSYGGKLYGMR